MFNVAGTVLLIDSTNPRFSHGNDYKVVKGKRKPPECESVLNPSFYQLASIIILREGLPMRIAEEITKLVILTEEDTEVKSVDIKSFIRKRIAAQMGANSNKLLAKYKELFDAIEVIRWKDLGISNKELAILHTGDRTLRVNLDVKPPTLLFDKNEVVAIYSSFLLTEPLIRLLKEIKKIRGYSYSYFRNEPKGHLGDEYVVINDSDEFFSFRSEFLKELQSKEPVENPPAFIDHFFVLDSPNVYQNDQPGDFIWQYIRVLSGSLNKVIIRGGGKYFLNRFLKELTEKVGSLGYIDCGKADDIKSISDLSGEGIVIFNVDKLSHLEFIKFYRELTSPNLEDKTVAIITDTEDIADAMPEFQLINLPEESDLKKHYARIFFHFAIYDRLIPFVDITDSGLYEKRKEVIYRLSSSRLIVSIFQIIPGLEEMKSLVGELWKYSINFDMALNEFSFWYLLKQFIMSRFSSKGSVDCLEVYLGSPNKTTPGLKVSQSPANEITFNKPISSATVFPEITKAPEREYSIPRFKLTHIKIDDKDLWHLTSNQDITEGIKLDYKTKKGVLFLAYLAKYYLYPKQIDVDQLADIVDEWYGRSKRNENSTKGTYHTIKEALRYVEKTRPELICIIKHLKIGKDKATFTPYNEMEIEIDDQNMPPEK